MKKKKELKRNSIAVRLTDADYDPWIAHNPKAYSSTLTRLIRLYNNDPNVRERCKK